MNLSTEDKRFIRSHLFADVRRLALSGIDPRLLVQIEGRQKIKDKVSSWYEQDELLYPPKLSLEQASSEYTARYKAQLVKGNTLVDLTGGLGVDCAFLSTSFQSATYVERQTGLCEIASHNFSVLGLNHIEVFNEDSEEFLERVSPVDCIYLDPARRSDVGRKVVLIEDCEPNILDIQGLLLEKAERVMVKLSPMLDIKRAIGSLDCVEEVHVVSVDNECKELLFLLKKDSPSEPLIHCVDIKKNRQEHVAFTYSEEKNTDPVFADQPEAYLYEPNASVMKAGYYKGIALQYGLKKLHPDSHLYTSSVFVPDFPGRTFRIDAVSSFNKKDIKDLFVDTGRANLAVRNFPLRADDLKKKLKLKDGGDVYVFATTLYSGKHILIKSSRL